VIPSHQADAPVIMQEIHFLDKAILIATKAHHGATDKGGRPYIEHPMRLMMAMSTDLEKAVAILHDVVEDTDVSLDSLIQQGIPREAVDAVDALSRRTFNIGKADERKEEYLGEFIYRIRQNELARKVKVADLYDNLDPKRMVVLSTEETGRMRRYHRALRILHHME
jgi:(p)ppGpp synthase/HD superfamily hydrolase